ncbi:MAG: 50S ribosomal protein L11 methyltransferase [Deltaproteobacteria bacterium]
MACADLSEPEWMEVSIHADPVALEGLSAALFELGCAGMVTDNFGDNIVKAYFQVPERIEELRKAISSSVRELAFHFPHLPPMEVFYSPVKNEDWAIKWREFFRKERVTPFLTIVPAWEPVCEKPATATIRMDPGPAFGTGKHPTTRLCLRAMELVAKPPSWDLLDVGTGSGFLAIYGSLLGAEKINAIDIDETALHWAEKNIRLNGAGERVELSSTPLAELKQSFFMVTANLILNTILDLMSHFPRVVNRAGWLILSGLLEDQVSRVRRSLELHGFVWEKSLFQGAWGCLLARRSS